MKIKETFLTPDYYNHFCCKCGDCRHTCCQGLTVNITQDELAKKVGKSRSHVTNIIGLLRLPKEVLVSLDLIWIYLLRFAATLIRTSMLRFALIFLANAECLWTTVGASCIQNAARKALVLHASISREAQDLIFPQESPQQMPVNVQLNY